MVIILSISCPFFALIRCIIQKPDAFKSSAGLTVKEFDGIYHKKLTKRYGKHDTKRLPNRKDRAIPVYRQISSEEKEFDQTYSKKRIVVEQIMSGLKKYRILSDVFRNK